MYPVLLGLLSALLFGASTPASKALLQGLDPIQLVWSILVPRLEPHQGCFDGVRGNSYDSWTRRTDCAF